MLNIIGSADENYMEELHQQMKDEGVVMNVTFTPSFPVRNDVFKQVAKSRIAVLPGITASLNSTVREAMLMGMPTIVYETPDTIIINQKSQNIITAKMEDVKDLASKMVCALENPNKIEEISKNGNDYARRHFSQSAFQVSMNSILSNILV